MSDCHSTTLVQRTTNAVQQYPAAQGKGVLPGDVCAAGTERRGAGASCTSIAATYAL